MIKLLFRLLLPTVLVLAGIGLLSWPIDLLGIPVLDATVIPLTGELAFLVGLGLALAELIDGLGKIIAARRR